MFLRRNENKYSPWNFSNRYANKNNNHNYYQYLPKSYSNNFDYDLQNDQGFNENSEMNIHKSRSNDPFHGKHINIIKKDQEYMNEKYLNYKKEDNFKVVNNHSQDYKQNINFKNSYYNNNNNNNNSNNYKGKNITLNKFEKKPIYNNNMISNNINSDNNNTCFANKNNYENREFKKNEFKKRMITKNSKFDPNTININVPEKILRPRLFPEENLKPNQMYLYNNSKSNTDKLSKKGENLIIK